MYKVQRVKVPIPPVDNRSHSSRRRRKYPFEEMAVGDWFFVDGSTRHTVQTYVYTVGKEIGRKFETRKVWAQRDPYGNWSLAEPGAKGAVEGIGVWRAK